MDQNKLIDLAWKARENAYVPYSHFKVGACIALKCCLWVNNVCRKKCCLWRLL